MRYDMGHRIAARSATRRFLRQNPGAKPSQAHRATRQAMKVPAGISEAAFWRWGARGVLAPGESDHREGQ
jgi:hypothetical protein